jgi:hypothetical protein
VEAGRSDEVLDLGGGEAVEKRNHDGPGAQDGEEAGDKGASVLGYKADALSGTHAELGQAGAEGLDALKQGLVVHGAGRVHDGGALRPGFGGSGGDVSEVRHRTQDSRESEGVSTRKMIRTFPIFPQRTAPSLRKTRNPHAVGDSDLIHSDYPGRSRDDAGEFQSLSAEENGRAKTG